MAPSPSQDGASSEKAEIKPVAKPDGKTFARYDWNEYIGKLRAYKEEHGTANVSRDRSKGRSLSRWVEVLRQRKDALSREQRSQLEELGLELGNPSRQKFGSRWDKMLAELLRFKTWHGHTRVPNPCKEHRSLGLWVKNQRANHQKGTLTEERKQRLEEIGFDFGTKGSRSPTAKDENLWNQKYQELVRFQEDLGHCRVPFPCPKNKKLGEWVHNLRTANAKGLVRADRKEKLDGIGFVWTKEKPNPPKNPKIVVSV